METDDLFRRNVSERLRVEKYRVFETSLEIEAKDIIRKSNIDVVLLGLRGFKGRGLALLKMIKETRPFTEVILLTPSDEHSLFMSIEAMKLGAFDDILVPFDLETLLNRIREAYQRKVERIKAKRLESRGGREVKSGQIPSGPGNAGTTKEKTDRDKEGRPS